MSEYAATTTAVRLKFKALDDFGAPVIGVTDLYAVVWRDSDDFIFDWSDDTFKTPASVVTMQGVLAEINATYLSGWYARTLPVQAGGTYNVIYGQVGSTVANLVGAHDEIIVGRLAVPGDPMDLVADAVDSAAVAPSAVTELQAGLATSTAQTTAQTSLTDLQGRLPAALISGRLDATVGAVQANVLTAAALAADAATEIASAVWGQLVGTPAADTFGAFMVYFRKRFRNRLRVTLTGGGQEILYDDDAVTPLETQTLRGPNGEAIRISTGTPADRGAAT